MMNTDAFFTLGRQHHVCQDYAMAMPGTVVLSDGCSSSPHTDFGSRLLCRMAYQHGMKEAIPYARPHLGSLALPLESLDATLLMAQFQEGTNSVQTSVHGDGVVVARKRDGGLVVVEVSFPSGAPLYPNYEFSASRKTRYRDEFGTRRVVHILGWDTPDDTEIEDVRLFDESGWKDPAYTIEFHRELFDLVMILSDGALSFRRPTSSPGLTEAVPLPEIIREMMAIKGYAGEFVTRRAKRFLKDAIAKGWYHEDDFSAAAIYLGGE